MTAMQVPPSLFQFSVFLSLLQFIFILFSSMHLLLLFLFSQTRHFFFLPPIQSRVLFPGKKRETHD